MAPHALSDDLATELGINAPLSSHPLSHVGDAISTKLTVPLEKAQFELEDRPLDDVPPLKVIVIGAGIAGVNAAVLLPRKVVNLDLKVYEKNGDIGGCWYENIYPGVRCDVDAHAYQSTFAPNTQWSQHYAEGSEILAYWQNFGRKYDAYKYITFNSKITECLWDAQAGKWQLQIENTLSGEKFTDDAHIVISAIGHFNAWKLPDYPGIDEFEGHLRHSSNWDPNFDPKDKTVALIGNGASGIQVLPGLQKTAKRVDHYARSPTWIAATEGPGKRARTTPFTAEELEKFKDADTYYKFRKEVETKFFRQFAGIFKGSKENNAMRRDIEASMRGKLALKPEVIDSILPNFAPACRRLTPGPGYLEAVAAENVDYISTPIQRFTKTGIVTEDGIHREVDAVICSTGANVSFAPPFPIIANGNDLSQAWQPGGNPGFAKTYFGIASPGFPNLLFVHGPSGGGVSGTVPHSVENQLTTVAKILRKVSQQGIKTITPSQAATDDFTEVCKAFFKKTVFSENCSSWFNGGIKGGYVHGLWPGSSTHSIMVRRDPRWEDWEYTYRTSTGNRYAYFGNGWTKKELQEDSDMTPYLRKNPEEIDLRSYHEEWWVI